MTSPASWTTLSVLSTMPTEKSSNMNWNPMARVSLSLRTPKRSMWGMDERVCIQTWGCDNYSHLAAKFIFSPSDIFSHFHHIAIDFHCHTAFNSAWWCFIRGSHPPLQVVCELAFPSRHRGSVSGPAERLQWGHPWTPSQGLWWEGTGGTVENFEQLSSSLHTNTTPDKNTFTPYVKTGNTTMWATLHWFSN